MLGAIERVQIAAASMTAALLLSAGSADAGVIMAQPKLQKASDSDRSPNLPFDEWMGFSKEVSRSGKV